MVNEHYIELMNKEVDGLNSPEESSRLSHILSQDTEAKIFFDEIKQVSHALQSVHSIETPSYLHKHIMNSLSLGQYENSMKPSFPLTFSSFRLPAFGFAHVLTLFIGVILGISALMLFSNQTIDNGGAISHVIGSTLTHSSITDLATAAETRFTFSEVDLHVTLQHSSDAVFVRLNGASAKNLIVQVHYPENNLLFDSFHRFDGEGTGFTFGNSGIEVPFEGENDLGFLFHTQSQITNSFNIRVFDGSHLLAERILSINAN